MTIKMEARYFRIANWDKFQHYKQRNPPWIRLHRTLLRDHKFLQLTEGEQWILVRLWLLASEAENRMAFDEKWVRIAIGSKKPVPLEKYAAMGFIETWREQDASSVLADGLQSAKPEAEGSEGTEDSEQYSTAQDIVDERVLRLLKACRDADDLTPKVLRKYARDLSEADVGFAIEAARGPGVQSPTKVCVAVLKQRAEARAA